MNFKNYKDGILSVIVENNHSILPTVLEQLHDEEGRFFADEGTVHDYKREYPFSNSDNVFASILRLICAFHNSYGGVIIFGVHDETRLAGRNKVKVDSEKINRKLREVLSQPLEISVYNYNSPSGEAQVLLVPVRKAMSPPVYINKKVGDYSPGKIYIRKGPEVLEAKGADLSFLYSDRSSAFSDAVSRDFSIEASLPPSPATIQEFVGRFRVIESIVNWVTGSRDPRMFLWGQGGSGKSTIAYEAAALIARTGGLVESKFGKKLDRVLYISGKATYLDPHTGRIKETYARDFKDGLDVFKSILTLSGWTASENIEKYNKDEALDALEELFELENIFIVIDDIDTLTTSSVDAGMEELLLILSRCRSGTKLLYTLRGFPSYAPNAAVEVPGLQGEEFVQFLNLCCEKFSVPAPTTEEQKWILEQSEGRPLAIETIIGMRRIASSYKEAFQRWKDNSSEAREYLFNREYQQLSRDDRARHLLAALAIFETPQSFEALNTVLQFSPDQLQDAIAETRDMFLRVSSGKAGSGDVYSIGAATRLFVSEISKKLDKYKTIEAKVHHFKKKATGSPAAYVPLIERANRLLQAGNAIDAVALLTKQALPEAFKEHPEVQALLGQSYAKLNPPRVVEARACFEAAYSLGFKHFRMYLDWLELERENRTEVVNGIAICRKVISGEGFEPKTQATFLGRLARLQVLRAKDLEMTAPHEAVVLRKESVINNLRAFSISSKAQDGSTLSFRERADNAISIALRSALRSDDFDSFFDIIEALLGEGENLDEFAETIASRITELETRRPKNWKPIVARIHRVIGQLRGDGSKNMTQLNGEKIKKSLDSMLTKARSTG